MKKAALILLCCLLLITGISCDSGNEQTSENSTMPKYTMQNYPKITLPPEYTTSSPYATDTSDIVYVSQYGLIHSRSNCSGMETYTAMRYNTARDKGYRLCNNCYH